MGLKEQESLTSNSLTTEIEQILAPGGILASCVEGYEHRQQQVRMAKEVYEALASDDRLIIEAPTGTGKTLAYLLAAAFSRKRIAISTGTKNLQEQLFFKDFPFVRDKVFPALKAALLKGRGNFVCHTRLRRFLRQPHLQGLGRNGPVSHLLEWYKQTRSSGEGDRSELENLPDDDPIWIDICSTTENCLGRKCSDREECFVHKMRARAAESDLMIVNHHLLCSDLAVRDSGFGEVIPRYEALIVDEAHGLEDAATQHFGFHLSHFRIARLVRDAQSELSAAEVPLGAFEKVLRDIEIDGRRLFATFDGVGTGRPLRDFMDAELVETGARLGGALDVLAAMLGNVPKASEELRGTARRSTLISQELQVILGEDETCDFARWVESRERSVMLHASPVEVGEYFKSKLYENVPAVVFTSATLATGGTFAYFKSRLGLEGEPQPSETILDSPFDYAAQTMLYIPHSMPEPNSPGFPAAVAAELKEVLSRTRGRAFALFTSYRNMQTAHEMLNGTLPYPLLVQGSRPKTKLLEEFRAQTGSVLFATSSFWEGVDVQGEALSCVIIDKLPFAPPGDPIISARTEKIRREGGEPFYSFQVPMAVLALKQGLGRLIRTRSDRGVLCILDIRILKKPYGKIFLQSLYESPVHREPNTIDSFFSSE